MQHKVFSQAAQLQNFEPYQWFAKECLEAKIGEARADACSTTKTDEECKIARHVLKALEDVKKWPAVRQGSAGEYIDARTKQG